MRILAHIHTLNDDDVIDRSLGAVLRQTRPVDGILIVDDGSNDATLKRDFPENVSVIRHGENLGTNGAVQSGMKFALEQGYDWIWTFDGDSAAHPDALEKLLDFYEAQSSEDKQKVLRLSSLAHDLATDEEHHGLVFTDRGFERVLPARPGQAYKCAVTIWSGCLFRLDAVREVGLPRLDYVLDWGELEYGYQGVRHGYESYVVPSSAIDHNIRGRESFHHSVRRFGPFKFRVLDVPPHRVYYFVRNWAHFWLYEFDTPYLSSRLVILLRLGVRTAKLLLKSLGRPAQFAACLRGLWDGLRRNLGRRH